MADQVRVSKAQVAAVRDQLGAVRSRGEIKRLGAEADRDPVLRAALLVLAREKGAEVETDLSGKRLVRAVLDRTEHARSLISPIRRDPGFTCINCGRAVSPGGARVRDHCPHCLRSLHVDTVPGDRAAGCGGVLEPIGFELKGRSGVVIHYRCRRCGYAWRGRAHPDDELPPGLDVGRLPPLRVGLIGASPEPQTPEPQTPEPQTPEPAAVASGAEPEGGREATPRWPDLARTLPLRVLDQVRRQRLWEQGDRVLVAVSGGLDSTVLLEVLARTAGGHGGRLEVASVDHGLRPEAVAEVARVARHAYVLGLPFHGLEVDIAPGPNLQARARLARAAVLAGLGADCIATAHHADDQAETVLYHLLRGSGATGLRGMQARGPGLADAVWVRPMLAERRETLRAFAESEGLSWVDDPSNPLSQRGELRRLLPQLDAVHGGAVDALARSARLLARDDALLESLTDACEPALRDGQGLELAGLRALNPALQLRLLRRLVAVVDRPVRADQLEAVLRWEPGEGAALPLPGGWRLVSRGGRLVVEKVQTAAQ